MLRFEDFAQRDQKKRVMVHSNGDFDNSKVMYMVTDWSYIEFLVAASNRLEIVPAAKRVFNANGVEIDDCMMIEDDDILFLSHGDDFIAPTTLLGKHGDSSDMGGADDSRGDKYPVVVGGYSVGKLLGKGGFGEVRVGIHQLTGEKVALKFLWKSDIHSIGAAERTTTEIQCLSSLKHHNIIRLMHHMETPKHVVLVFELMEGGDLHKFLIARGPTAADISLPEDEARQLFHQIVSAVSYAHNQHICHRDLKLENILLKGPSLAHVKIADFGLSDFYRPGAVMKSNCGTLSFLAPEVFSGTATAGPPLDVWALGVILFSLLCGRLPFEGSELNGDKRPRDVVIKSKIMKCQYKIDENLGIEAKDLVRRMLKLDPVERASIPEIFGHVWLRSVVSHHLSEVEFLNSTPQITSRRPTVTPSSLPSVIVPAQQSSLESSSAATIAAGGGGRSPSSAGTDSRVNGAGGTIGGSSSSGIRRITPVRTLSDGTSSSGKGAAADKSPSAKKGRDRARTVGDGVPYDEDDSEVAAMMMRLGSGSRSSSGTALLGSNGNHGTTPAAAAAGEGRPDSTESGPHSTATSVYSNANNNSRNSTPVQGRPLSTSLMSLDTGAAPGNGGGNSSFAPLTSSRRQRSSNALDRLGTLEEESELLSIAPSAGPTPKKGSGMRMSISRSLSSSPTGEIMSSLQDLRREYEKEKKMTSQGHNISSSSSSKNIHSITNTTGTGDTDSDNTGILPPLPIFTSKQPQSNPGSPSSRFRRHEQLLMGGGNDHHHSNLVSMAVNILEENIDQDNDTEIGVGTAGTMGNFDDSTGRGGVRSHSTTLTAATQIGGGRFDSSSHSSTAAGGSTGGGVSSFTTPSAAAAERNSRFASSAQQQQHQRGVGASVGAVINEDMAQLAISMSKSYMTPPAEQQVTREEHRLPKVMSVPAQSSLLHQHHHPQQLLHLPAAPNDSSHKKSGVTGDMQRSRHGDDDNTHSAASSALPRSATSTPISFKLEPLRRRVNAPEPEPHAAIVSVDYDSDDDGDAGAVTVIARGKAAGGGGGGGGGGGMQSGSYHGDPSVVRHSDSSDALKNEFAAHQHHGGGNSNSNTTGSSSSLPKSSSASSLASRPQPGGVQHRIETTTSTSRSGTTYSRENGTIVEGEVSDIDSPRGGTAAGTATAAAVDRLPRVLSAAGGDHRDRDRDREQQWSRRSTDRDRSSVRISSTEADPDSLSPTPYNRLGAAAGVQGTGVGAGAAGVLGVLGDNSSVLKDSVDDVERAVETKKKHFPNGPTKPTGTVSASTTAAAMTRGARRNIDVAPSYTLHASANGVIGSGSGSASQREKEEAGKGPPPPTTTSFRKVVDEFAPEDTMGLRERSRDKEKDKKDRDRDRERERERERERRQTSGAAGMNANSSHSIRKRDVSANSASGGGGSAFGSTGGGSNKESYRKSRTSTDGY